MKKILLVFIGLIICVSSLCNCANTAPDDKTQDGVDSNIPAISVESDDNNRYALEPSSEQRDQISCKKEPDEDEFVKVRDYIPDIYVELKYNTTDNFTGQKIYDFSDAYLRYGTVKKLIDVQEELEKENLYLKIWDAFRPTYAQFVLWEICPDATYVANPNNGFSSHSRGNTVDVTLVDKEGNEVVMPTMFDDFSDLADRDYSDCTEEAKRNVEKLEQIMVDKGFKAYYGEWWHYTDEDEYSVDEKFLSADDRT